MTEQEKYMKAALNLVLLDTTEQSTDVVACFSVVEQLAEHLDTGYNGLARSVHQTNDCLLYTSRCV